MEYTFKNNKIAILRKEAELSQRQVVGTSQANLSRWEQGLNQPSWRLADYFGVSIDYLCGRSEI